MNHRDTETTEKGSGYVAGGEFGALPRSLLAMIAARKDAIGRLISGSSRPVLTLVKWVTVSVTTKVKNAASAAKVPSSLNDR